MNLVERYIHAVRNYLPRAARKDIGDEIRSILEAKLEGEEEERGGPLSEGDVAGMLEEFGHPLEVAAGYQSRRALISERAFPMYREVITRALLILLSVQLVLSLLPALASNPGNWLWDAGRISGELMDTAVSTFAWVTLGFFVIDGWLVRNNPLSSWNPLNLPSPDQSWRQISRGSMVVEILFTLAFLSFIHGFFPPSGSIFSQREVVPLDWTEAARSFRPWVTALGLISVALALGNYWQPWWTRRKLVLCALIQLAEACVFFALNRVDSILTASPDPVGVEDLGQTLLPIAEGGIRIFLLIVVAILVFEVLRDAYRAIRWTGPGRY